MQIRLLILAVLFFALAASNAHAQDNLAPTRVYFKSGGSILGTIISEPKEDRKSYLVLRTSSGSVLKLDKSRIIQRVADNARTEQEYQKMLASVGNTPDDHWKMYEWCKKESSKFKEQIEFHLRQIVALDPSDDKAWQRLNYIEVDGRWVPEEQHYLSHGYVKRRGRWVSKLQLEFDSQSESADDEFNARKKALRNWQMNTIKNKDYETIRSELFKIIDPISVSYFEDKFLKKEEDPEKRMLLIDAVGNVHSRAAQRILVKYAIEDPNIEVRDQALLHLEQEQYGRAYTAARLTRYLTQSRNRLINRAGQALSTFQHPDAILPLVAALRTTHKVPTGRGPGQMNTSFDSNGGVGFSTGGPKSVDVTVENPGVLEALSNMTGQDFQDYNYDAQRWREWYVLNHTVINPGLRSEFEDSTQK